ncbi:MAG TPA: zinc-ribbon domain-containing protein [Candidatus Polarisedimenticolia bacterium]|nr:zinc-ribbon domain-containing protein [Candidatus Polarisedimenticolia bacterium]
MVVNCPGCNTRYMIDDRRISAKGAMLNCRECAHSWKITPPGAPSAKRTVPTPQPAAHSVAQPTPPALPAQQPPARTMESSGRLASPTTCPKCGHLFVPGSASAQQTGSNPRATVPTRPRILLVEDQNYFAELTCEALRETYDTTVAGTLDEASSLLQGGGYDLVILDLSLEEGQDGTHVLRATKQQKIPVLIFTARDETELYGGAWDQLKAAGATDILIKGIHVGDELKKKVKSLLQDHESIAK